MAYKYAPRENSTSDLIAMQAQSSYAFSGRKASNIDREQAMNLYNRRAKSINMGAPNAAPSSGTAGIMFNDTSATNLPDQSSPVKETPNEVVVVTTGSQPVREEQPTQEADEATQE